MGTTVKKKGNRLSSMTFDEVSVVTNPANQHSKIVLWKSGDDDPYISKSGEVSPDYEWAYIEKREFSTKRREKLAGENKALPDGSFPIVNAEDLRNAIKAIGRAGEGKRATVMAHIKRRAKKLGLTNLLPEGWGGVEKAGACSYDHRKLGKNQRCPDCGMRSSGRGGKMRKSTWQERVAEILKAASGSEVLGSTGTNGDDDLDAIIANYQEEEKETKEESPMGKLLIDDVDLDDLPEDVRKAVEELVTDNKSLTKGIVEKQEEVDNLTEALDELEGDEDDDISKNGDDDDGDDDDGDEGGGEDEIAKTLAKIEDPSIRKIVEKSMRDAQTARLAVKDALEKAEEERDIRLDKEYIAKAEVDFHNLAMKPSEIGPAMRQLHDAAPALYDALEKVLKGADAAVKQSKITKTIGSDGTQEEVIGGSVVDKVEAKAAELRKADSNLTKEASIAKALAEEPALYHEYRQAAQQEAFARQMPNV